ncbi:MAG: nucleotidyltransferase [Adlercreutzia sp.]|nr:nucleotidyltransferase [Adlercreutzia sp.]
MKKYDNYVAQLAVLQRAKDEDLSNEFVMSGVASKFALQFELAWKLLKETLAYEGNAVAASGSPREILKASFATYDFIDEAIWLEMLKARNDLMHVYDGEAARQMAERIVADFVPAFERVQAGLEELYEGVLFDGAAGAADRVGAQR